MGQTAAQIESYIEQQRKDLGENVKMLEAKLRSAFSWRTQFQQRPATMLGIAFAAGFLLSLLGWKRSHSRAKGR